MYCSGRIFISRRRFGGGSSKNRFSVFFALLSSRNSSSDKDWLLFVREVRGASGGQLIFPRLLTHGRIMSSSIEDDAGGTNSTRDEGDLVRRRMKFCASDEDDRG